MAVIDEIRDYYGDGKAVNSHVIQSKLANRVRTGKASAEEKALYSKLQAIMNEGTDEGLDDQSYNRYGANAAAAWMDYVRKIKNAGKKKYAKSYLDFCLGIDKAAPDAKECGISYMAAQAVRMELAEFGIEPGDGPDGGKDEATTYETRWGLVEVSPPGWKHSVEAMKRDQRKGKMDKGINPFALAWSMKKKGAKPHYGPHGKKDEAHEPFPPLGVSSAESAVRAEAAGFVLEGTEVGQEILRQLGGGKFIAMTGSKNFVGGENSLAFRVGRNDKGVNYVRITLDPLDTYTVEFLSLRGTKSTVKSKVENVYVDSLRDVFTEGTGLYTSLGTMRHKPTNEAQDPAVKSTSARVKSYFKKNGPKDVRVRGSQGKSTFIEAWISRFNPENPHTLADVPGFSEDVRRKALVVIYGKDMGTSAGNVSSHQITMSAAQWNKFLDQLEGKPSTNESEDGRQVAYLTGDDAERALKSIGSPNKANVALWLRKNLSRLDDMGTQDGGEFEDDYESSAVSVNVEGVPYTVRIGDDFVVVFCDESVDEAKVKVSGATYTLVKKNDDGTVTVRNENGDEFDSEPGEEWTEVGEAPKVSGPKATGMSRAAYIAAEKKAMQAARQGNLDAVVARIEKEYKTKALPAGISKVQHLLTAPRLQAADRKLRTEYNVAKQNADADYRGDELHWGRVWDRANGKNESVGSADPMASIRKILVQNAGRYYTADQLAKAIGVSQSEALKAASRLVTQGTAQFKRGEGYSLAGNSKALQLPAERAHQLRISDRRTNDYTQRDADKAARRKREESLAEEFAVVRGEKDALEYWTGEGWTDERGSAKLFDTQEESDAEAERLEQADETTTSGGVGGFRAFPLGKRPAAPINVGSIPDVAADDEEDDEADEDELDEGDSYSEPKKRAAVDARMKESRLKGLREAVRSGDKKRIGMYLEAAERDGYGAEARKIATSKDESMGVGATPNEVVKRGSKWFVVPPDGTREQSFDDEKTATEVAQGLATRENYAVVVTRGTKKPVEETHGSGDYVDVQWQDGRYTVTPPRSWDMKPGDVEEFDSLADAYARALDLAVTNFWVVLIWNLKPGDKAPTQGQTSPADPTAAQGADESYNEQERTPRGGESPARPSAPKAAETRREVLSFDESALERYVLAAQAAGVDLNTQVTHEDGSYSLRLPTTDAARVRELVGVS
jgi:biotin operon repressor